MNSTRKFLSVAGSLIVIVIVVYFVRSALQGETAAPQSTSTPSPTLVVFTPVTPIPHFNVVIPQKALLKNYVTVTVEAPAGTECKLTFVPESSNMAVMETVADENGLCIWKWKLDEAVGKGNARLIFTINGISDTHFLQIFKEF